MNAELGGRALFLARLGTSETLEPDALLAAIAEQRFPELGALTLADLARLGDRPNGVYVAHDEHGKVWYVGKATSRSFAERLPAHLDPRPDAWLNTIPRRILAMGLATSYADALEIALGLRVALIGAADSSQATQLESKLRVSLAPVLNFRSRQRRSR